MKITLDFELTGEVRIETVKPQFDLNLINRRSANIGPAGTAYLHIVYVQILA